MTKTSNCPSIYITKLNPNVTQTDVKNVINKLNVGVIKYVNIKQRTTHYGDHYMVAYVYFNKWLNNPVSARVRDIIHSGKDVNVVHDGFWYWKIMMNRMSTPN
jgi:hypothetical protein